MRAAGDVSIAVPRSSNFRAGVRSPGAFWLTGNASTMPMLYWGSSARVVRDVRRAFGLTDGTRYDIALGDRLADRWSEMRPSGADEIEWSNTLEGIRVDWRDDEVLPLSGLRALIWWTYLRTVHPGGPGSVLFSRDIGLPRINADIGTVDVNVSIGTGDLDANRLAYNPFSGETPRGGEPVYNPWCTERTGCDPYRQTFNSGKKPGGLSGSAGTALVVVALLALAGSRGR